MASPRDLRKLNYAGDLGSLLIETFHGKSGRLNPRKDSDLLIGFESKEATPTIEKIRGAVIKHYTELGFVVEPRTGPRNMFVCTIHAGDMNKGFVSVVISTDYPLTMGDEHKHIRVTTAVNS